MHYEMTVNIVGFDYIVIIKLWCQSPCFQLYRNHHRSATRYIYIYIYIITCVYECSATLPPYFLIPATSVKLYPIVSTQYLCIYQCHYMWVWVQCDLAASLWCQFMRIRLYLNVNYGQTHKWGSVRPCRLASIVPPPPPPPPIPPPHPRNLTPRVLKYFCIHQITG